MFGILDIQSLTGRAREEVAHFSSDGDVATDMRPEIESGGQVAFEFHPELVVSWEAHDMGNERRSEKRQERVVDPSC